MHLIIAANYYNYANPYNVNWRLKLIKLKKAPLSRLQKAPEAKFRKPFFFTS